MAAHYRSMVEFDTSVGEAAANWERFTGFADRAAEAVGPGAYLVGMLLHWQRWSFLARSLRRWMTILALPQALAAVHEEVRLGNIALAEGQAGGGCRAACVVRAMLTVLGLDPWIRGGVARSPAAPRTPRLPILSRR